MGSINYQLLSTFEVETESARQYEMSSRRKCVHYLIALFVFANDVADLFADWLFFADVELMKPGLVYGPPSDSVWWAILIFSIIGTILFFMEAVNLYYETVRDDAWVDSDILSMVVVWIEDVPQVAISLYLVLCREEAISVFQLVKAGVVLFGTIIRLIQVGVKYFKKGEKHRHHFKIKIAIFIGMLLQAIASIIVFVLGYTAPTDGGISFQVPTTLVEETFNDRRYFANVSVFVNHAQYFDVDGLRVPERTDREKPVVNWMRLSSIDHIMAEGKGNGLRFNIEYEADPSSGVLRLAWWKKPTTHGKGTTDTSRWEVSGCYIVNNTAGLVSEVQNPASCTRTAGFFTVNSRNGYITFGYTKPGVVFRQQTFGDITFNMRLDSNAGVCREVEDYTSSLDAAATSDMPLRFHYFQTAKEIPPQGTGHLLKRGDTVRFFRNDGDDMTEIAKVWRTGWMECDSMGNLSPTMNKALEVKCSRYN